MLELIRRDPKYIHGYKEYCREFFEHQIIWFVPTNPSGIDDTWFERTKDWYDCKELGLVAGLPKSLHYWAVDGERFIGEFQLRPELTEQVMNEYGSIGYSVRISEQGKGYGQQILRQGLDIARNYGLEKVLLNINAGNSVSVHICKKLGGVLYDSITTEKKGAGKQIKHRYWIYL